MSVTLLVRFNDGQIWILGLRILVEVLHVRMRRRAIQVEVILLNILPVISLAVAQPEQALLEDRIASVPERHRETKQLAVIGDAGKPVLTPSVSTVLRVIMGEVIPCVAAGTVVFAHRSPLPLTQIGSPLLPRGPSFAVVLEPGLFRAGFTCLVCQ